MVEFVIAGAKIAKTLKHDVAAEVKTLSSTRTP